MAEKNEDQLYELMLQTVNAAAQLPFVKVDRKAFLKAQFKDSQYLDKIIADGPQAVFTIDTLNKKAAKIIDALTNQTTAVSFAAGLPGNLFVAVATGTADIAQYFGFALNMAQQIAYLYGEDDLFEGNTQNLPEDVKVRIVAYLGVMMGASGAQKLLNNVAKVAGENIGKRVANKALTKTAWFPIVKKVGAILGQKITKKTVEKTIAKAVPLIGGVVSGGMTYLTFKPMGQNLAKTFAQHLNGEFDMDLELNPAFLKSLENETPPVVEGEVID